MIAIHGNHRLFQSKTITTWVLADTGPAVALLLVLLATSTAAESLFQDGVESTFRWHAEIATGTKLPSHVLSHWLLSATLRVQGSPHDGALIQVGGKRREDATGCCWGRGAILCCAA